MNKYYARNDLNGFFDRMIESYEPCSDKYDAAVEIKGASYSISASDVKPIIYAEWLLINNPNYSPFDRSKEYVYQCTNCKTIQDYRTLFCSHCGADMRRGKNG